MNDMFTSEEIQLLIDGLLCLSQKAYSAKNLLNDLGCRKEIDKYIEKIKSLTSKICIVAETKEERNE